MPINRIIRITSTADAKFGGVRSSSVPLAWDDSAQELVAKDTLGAAQRITNVRYATGSLTSAQVKALRATPATLVAAPGAGKVLQFISLGLFLDYGSNGFTETVDNLAVKYENGSGVTASQAIEMTGFIDQTADTFTNGLPKIDAIAAKTACDNKPLVLHNTGDGEIAGNAAGDSVLRWTCAYRVLSAGW